VKVRQPVSQYQSASGERPTTPSKAERRTDGAGQRYAFLGWLECEDAAVPGRDTYAPAEVRAKAEHGAVSGEKRAFAARGAACGVRRRPWVARPAPERIIALEARQRLRYICLSDDDGTGITQHLNELLIRRGTDEDGSNRAVSPGLEREERTENVRRRRAQLDFSPTACIRSCCRNL
jgi:hypothetical protein